MPIITLLGIAWIRLSHGLAHGFEAPSSKAALLVVTATLLSAQSLFGMIGWVVMRRLGYFRKYVFGDKANAGSFAVICPGVALFVFGFFFISVGLVQTGLVGHLSPAYLALVAILARMQGITLYGPLLLRRKVMLA